MSAMLTFDPLGPGVPASPCEPCQEYENIINKESWLGCRTRERELPHKDINVGLKVEKKTNRFYRVQSNSS